MTVGAEVGRTRGRFGISRKNGYKWLHRFLGNVASGFEDQSRRPHTSPMAVDAAVEAAIVEARKRRPRWGPKKLRASFLRANPEAGVPSVGTFARILKRHGLARPRRRAKRTPPSTDPLAHATAPNVLWCIDFKGDFEVGSSRCYPLTLTAISSRAWLFRIPRRTRWGQFPTGQMGQFPARASNLSPMSMDRTDC